MQERASNINKGGYKMMKRLIPLLVLCAIALGTGQAFAERKLVWETINFRTSSANVNGFVDSSAFANGATSYHTDTTIWINTANWALPNANAPTPDSLWAVVVIVPTSSQGHTASADSFYVFGETSNDGSWAALGDKIEPMNLGATQIGSGATMAAVLLEDAGTNNTFRGVWHLATVRVGNVSGSVASYAQAYGAPFIRLRVMSDATGAFVLRVGHYVTDF